MDVSANDIEILTELQAVDREVTLAQRNLDTLPQREKILEVRTQKASILKKKIQVQDMLDNAEEEFNKLFEEDEKLEKKQKESEEGIETSGDFRTIEARTKELNGIVKRRRTLEAELEKSEEQIERIKPVLHQVLSALDALDKKEAQLIAEFREQGGALQNIIARGNKTHAELMAEITPELQRAYTAALERCGGIALAFLEGNTCGACRSAFDSGRMVELRAQAPLAQCPHCKRLLIIK